MTQIKVGWPAENPERGEASLNSKWRALGDDVRTFAFQNPGATTLELLS